MPPIDALLPPLFVALGVAAVLLGIAAKCLAVRLLLDLGRSANDPVYHSAAELRPRHAVRGRIALRAVH